MTLKTTMRIAAAGLLAFAIAGCGGNSSTDTGATDAVADQATVDIAGADTTVDDGQPRDTIDETKDAAQDAVVVDSSAVDVPADTTADDVTEDVEPEFHWASGCTGTPTGASWTLIEDSTFQRGPMIQLSDRNTATVLWRPEYPVSEEGCVDYVIDGETLTECGQPDARGQYEVTLNDLPAATEINYSVRVGETKTKALSFRTMPDTPAPMKFAVFADAHCQVDNLQKMTQIALAEGVDFVLGVGDFVAQPEPLQYDLTMQGLQNLGSRVNVWTVIGNHDTGASEETGEYEFFNTFASPIGIPDEAAAGFGEGYWDKRIGNVWLGGGWVRDFYFSAPDSDFGEVKYFRDRFQSEEYKTAQWKLFFIHEPPYCQGWGGCSYSGESCLRTSLVPLAAQNGIQAMFHGHMHGYEYGQTEGVWTILPGGLGGALDEVCEATPELPQPWTYNYVHNFAIVEAGCDKLVVRFMNLDGGEYDRIEIPYVAPAE